MDIDHDIKIYLSGHQGMVGSAIYEVLQEKGYTNIITQTRAELDLLDQAAVRDYVLTQKPDLVIVAAAKVGASMQTTPTLRNLFTRT